MRFPEKLQTIDFHRPWTLKLSTTQPINLPTLVEDLFNNSLIYTKKSKINKFYADMDHYVYCLTRNFKLSLLDACSMAAIKK